MTWIFDPRFTVFASAIIFTWFAWTVYRGTPRD